MNRLEEYNKGNLFGKENNLELKEVSKGKIKYTMQLENKHLAVFNLVHGGSIAGFMDAILSVAAFSAVVDQYNVATVEFKINYLRAVKHIQKLTGKGRVVKEGSKLLFVEGEILNEENELVATGSGTIIKIKREN